MLSTTTHNLFKEYTEKELLRTLVNDTLYIPAYVLIKFNEVNANERKREEKDLLSNYQYKYKVLPEEELSQKILNDEKRFYYLSYVKGSNRIFITVFDSKDGKIAYSRSAIGTYIFKPVDVRELSRAVESSGR